MPRTNGKAKWAERTITEAVATAKDIMRTTAIAPDPQSQWNNYFYAGFYAATILATAIALVDHMENAR